jgi:hypothetical protein
VNFPKLLLTRLEGVTNLRPTFRRLKRFHFHGVAEPGARSAQVSVCAA